MSGFLSLSVRRRKGAYLHARHACGSGGRASRSAPWTLLVLQGFVSHNVEVEDRLACAVDATDADPQRRGGPTVRRADGDRLAIMDQHSPVTASSACR